MRIHLIPGINIRHYYESIGVFGDYFRKMGITVVDHPKFIPFGTAFLQNRGFIREIANTAHAADVLVAHSNGCAVAHGVSKLMKVKGLIFLNAALDRKLSPGYVDFIHNWYCPGDDVLPFSKLIPNHEWGNAGKKGIISQDPRVKNHNMKNYVPAVRGHSDIFDGKHAHFWAPRIGRLILEECGISTT